MQRQEVLYVPSPRVQNMLTMTVSVIAMPYK